MINNTHDKFFVSLYYYVKVWIIIVHAFVIENAFEAIKK
jgi:hypothetical protein